MRAVAQFCILTSSLCAKLAFITELLTKGSSTRLFTFKYTKMVENSENALFVLKTVYVSGGVFAAVLLERSPIKTLTESIVTLSFRDLKKHDHSSKGNAASSS